MGFPSFSVYGNRIGIYTCLKYTERYWISVYLSGSDWTTEKEKASEFRSVAEEKAAEFRTVAESKANEYRAKAEETYQHARTRARTLQEEGEAYVRENPLRGVLTALGVGFVLGLIFRR